MDLVVEEAVEQLNSLVSQPFSSQKVSQFSPRLEEVKGETLVLDDIEAWFWNLSRGLSIEAKGDIDLFVVRIGAEGDCNLEKVYFDMETAVSCCLSNSMCSGRVCGCWKLRLDQIRLSSPLSPSL